MDFVGTPGSHPNRRFGWVRIYWALVLDESSNHKNLGRDTLPYFDFLNRYAKLTYDAQQMKSRYF